MAIDFFSTSTAPAVETKYGMVRGYRFDGIYTFFGIPYAKAKRFMMPEEPDCWEGYRDATNWGYVAPLMERSAATDTVPRRFWLENENCQNLNIWSPTIDADAKKPVLVWIHGGGYFSGSPFAHTDYDGDELAKYGNCVVVSLTHRLNVLGYLDLSAFGEKYQNSGNAGQADLVAALRWIKENIAGFGGDPDNVTICGQSGGGGKVVTLMQTPEADGLFQKAMIMSGGMTLRDDETKAPAANKAMVEAMLAELGLTAKSIAVLEELPYEELVRIYYDAVPKVEAQGFSFNFCPVANGYYVGHPLRVGLTEHAKTIPVLCGTVFSELVPQKPVENKNGLTEEEATAILRNKFGDDTDHVISMYRKAYPERRLIDLYFLESGMRSGAIEFARYFASNSNAPIYNYYLVYNFEFNDGKPATHSSDQVLQFHNVDKIPFANGAHIDRIQDQYAGMWVNLGYTGAPGGKEFDEQWRPFTMEDQATMVIGEITEMRSGYDAELIFYLRKNFPDPRMVPMSMRKRKTIERPEIGI